MTNFVFISPESTKTYFNFCDRLKKNGINVLAISSTSYDDLSNGLKGCLTEYYKINDMNNYNEIVKAMGYFTYKYGKIDWVESNNENYLTLDAKIRKDFNITTGINSDEIINYTSRIEMKKFYREARIPTLRYSSVSTLDKAKLFVERVGYPISVRNDNCSDYSTPIIISDDEGLVSFFKTMNKNTTYIMEEYITGEIYTYDGICDNNGEVLFEASHIIPSSDEISYYTNIKVSNRLSSVAKKAIKSFNIKSRFFHFEFLKLDETKRGLGKSGRYIACEANIRPGSIYSPDMINYANSLDIYQLWADMIAYNKLAHTYNGDKYYCIYAGRNDKISYMHSKDDIMKNFGCSLVMSERNDDKLASVLGNEMFTAKVETMKQLESFREYVLEKK